MPRRLTPAELVLLRDAIKKEVAAHNATLSGVETLVDWSDVWKKVKDAIRGPGGKLPRPGRGLPSRGGLTWVLLALAAYMLTKGGGREADFSKYALVAVLAYVFVLKPKPQET